MPGDLIACVRSEPESIQIDPIWMNIDPADVRASRTEQQSARFRPQPGVQVHEVPGLVRMLARLTYSLHLCSVENERNELGREVIESHRKPSLNFQQSSH